jgi:PAS domain S-box-containing protein
MDSAGQIRAWNPEAERTFGWTESEAIGRVLADTIIPKRYRNEHWGGLEHFLATGQGRLLNRRTEIEALHRDGHIFPVELTISAVPVGDSYAFNAFLHDITERRAAESVARERRLADVRAADARAAQRRIVEAADAATRRLTRDLHDGAQQHLVNALIKFQLAQQKMPSEPERARELVDAGIEHATDGMAELRDLAAGAFPAILTSRGLSAALEALVARAPLPINIELSFGELPPATEVSIYFFCSEGLTNMVKHAQASSGWISIRRDVDLLSVEVRDDGVGGADRDSDGSGLAGLADRVEALDGTFTLTSNAGSGTSLRAEIPLPPR